MDTSWRTHYFKTLGILTAAALLASGPVFAEDTANTGGPGGPNQEQRKAYLEKILQEHPDLKTKLDTNGDGTVTPEEAKAGHKMMEQARREHRQERFEEYKKKFDTNGDGTISDEEKAAAKTQWQEKKQERREEFKKKFDTNGDGEISTEEKAAAREQWKEKRQERREEFKQKFDTDGNGKLSKDEKYAAREQWKENHPGQKYDRDNNPPGKRGGPGTNWENRPGPQGGPGASPDQGGKRKGWGWGKKR